MTRDVVTVKRDLSMRELGRLFETTDYNGYPVEEDSQVIGFVTKFDYLACFEFTPARMLPHYDDLMKRTVGDVMTADFIYCPERHQIDPGAAAHGRASYQEHAGD